MNDPIAILKKDHREAEALIKRLEATKKPSATRRQTLDKLEAALTLHMAIEEQILYPVVTEKLGEEPTTEAEVEHTLARDVLADMRRFVEAPGFGAAVAMFKAGIKHHVKEEETDMFPKLKKKLDAPTLRKLGDDVAEMKKAKPAPARRAA